MNDQQHQNEAACGGSALTAVLELLPCPFCWHTPVAKNGKVKCANLQCKVQPKISAWYVNTAEGMENAARDWNTRRSSNVQGKGLATTDSKQGDES